MTSDNSSCAIYVYLLPFCRTIKLDRCLNVRYSPPD